MLIMFRLSLISPEFLGRHYNRLLKVHNLKISTNLIQLQTLLASQIIKKIKSNNRINQRDKFLEILNCKTIIIKLNKIFNKI